MVRNKARKSCWFVMLQYLSGWRGCWAREKLINISLDILVVSIIIVIWDIGLYFSYERSECSVCWPSVWEMTVSQLRAVAVVVAVRFSSVPALTSPWTVWFPLPLPLPRHNTQPAGASAPVDWRRHPPPPRARSQASQLGLSSLLSAIFSRAGLLLTKTKTLWIPHWKVSSFD